MNAPVPEGAMMCAPASTNFLEIAASCAILFSLSMKPSGLKMPQWPWSVYGQRQTSQAMRRSGKRPDIARMAIVVGFEALQEYVRSPFPSNPRLKAMYKPLLIVFILPLSPLIQRRPAKFNMISTTYKSVHMKSSFVPTFSAAVTANKRTDFSPIWTSGSKNWTAALIPIRFTPGMDAIFCSSSGLSIRNMGSINWETLCKDDR